MATPGGNGGPGMPCTGLGTLGACGGATGPAPLGAGSTFGGGSSSYGSSASDGGASVSASLTVAALVTALVLLVLVVTWLSYRYHQRRQARLAAAAAAAAAEAARRKQGELRCGTEGLHACIFPLELFRQLACACLARRCCTTAHPCYIRPPACSSQSTEEEPPLKDAVIPVVVVHPDQEFHVAYELDDECNPVSCFASRASLELPPLAAPAGGSRCGASGAGSANGSEAATAAEAEGAGAPGARARPGPLMVVVEIAADGAAAYIGSAGSGTWVFDAAAGSWRYHDAAGDGAADV